MAEAQAGDGAEGPVIGQGPEPAGGGGLLPGLAICTIASLAAAFLSGQYGAPIILMGLLLGLALNFVASDPRTHPGLDFAGRTCLRIGIVLLGTQVTLMQIGALGPVPFAALLVVMGCAVAAALLAARLAGVSSAAGVLAGGSTAICGASAALALYGVIGRERLSQAQFTLTLVGISLASALAMSLYPPLGPLLNLDDRQAGFLIGASIAMEPGSEGAGPQRRGLLSRLAIPWFVLGFLGLVCLVSIVPLPAPATVAALAASKALLLLAVTATAMRTRVDLIMQMGWRAALPVLAATIASLLSALGFALVLL